MIETKTVNNRLIKAAYEIAGLGIPRMSKKAFCTLLSKFVGRDVSDMEVVATLAYFTGAKGLFVENAGEICVVSSMLGCSKCVHVIIRGWHESENRCALSGVVLEKDISKAGRCDRFNPTYLELG